MGKSKSFSQGNGDSDWLSPTPATHGRRRARPTRDENHPVVVTEVKIELRDDDYVLLADGVQTFAIPSEYKTVFGCFVRKVFHKLPHAVVPWNTLHRSLHESNAAPSRASTGLRLSKADLEKQLKCWGRTPDGKAWILPQRGSNGGYHLNPSVVWIAGRSVKKDFSRKRHSVAARSTDPHTMGKNTPNRS